VLTKSKEISFADAVEANRAFSSTVKEHIRATYAHFTGGLAMTGTFAYIFHRTGWSTRLMMSKTMTFN
jgi:FtsH-binding integral membrane protein